MKNRILPFFIRMAMPSDAPECRALDVDAWGEESAATEEMFRSRIEIYPFGNFVAIDRASGKIVGTVWTVATNIRQFDTWWNVSGGGTYRGACDAHGDCVFGINLSVPPAHARRGVGEALVERVVSAAWIAGRKKAMLGARMPYYHLWQKVFSAEDYIRLYVSMGRLYFKPAHSKVAHEGPTVDEMSAAKDGPRVNPLAWPVAVHVPEDAQIFDGEVRFFANVQVSGVAGYVSWLLPEYFPDSESCNNGVLVGWDNPDHPDYGR